MCQPRTGLALARGECCGIERILRELLSEPYDVRPHDRAALAERRRLLHRLVERDHGPVPLAPHAPHVAVQLNHVPIPDALVRPVYVLCDDVELEGLPLHLCDHLVRAIRPRPRNLALPQLAPFSCRHRVVPEALGRSQLRENAPLPDPALPPECRYPALR